jgi:hypothetical protein
VNAKAVRVVDQLAELADVTATGLALGTAANPGAARTTLELGTAALAATGDFDPAGTAAAAVVTHVGLSDPHTQYLLESAAASGYQPLDSDLTAIAALTTTSYGRGFLVLADAAAGRTALGLGSLATQSGTFSGTSSGINTGDQTITLTGDVTGSGTGSFAATLATVATAGTYKSVTVDVKGRVTAGTNPTTLSGYGITDAQPLDADLTALAALSGTNTIYYRSAASTWTAVTVGTGLTFTGGTLSVTTSTYQPLDSDLTAIAALTTASYGRSLLTATDVDNLLSVAGLGDLAIRNGLNSGLATNITGLFLGTGGTTAAVPIAVGIATFLGTPSSANLRTVMTDETGTGSLVFATTPTLVTPVLGAATATSVYASASVAGGQPGLKVRNTSSNAAANCSLELYNDTGDTPETDGLVLLLYSSGAGAPSGAYLWNRENGQLSFGTNNTQRMAISAAGAVSVTGALTAATYGSSVSTAGVVVPIEVTNTSAGAGAQTRIKINNDSGTTSTDGVMFYLNGTGNSDPSAFGLYSFESGQFVLGIGGTVQVTVSSAGLAAFKQVTATNAGATSLVPLLAKGVSGQVADLIQARDSSDNVLAGFAAGGGLIQAQTTPTALAANTNNWALPTAGVVRISASAAYNLTGITAPTTGRVITLVNVGSFTITLKHQDASSTAANRLLCKSGADVTLPAEGMVGILYDLTTQRWRVNG